MVDEKLRAPGIISDNAIVRTSVNGREGLARLEGVTVPVEVDPDTFYFEQYTLRLGRYDLRRARLSPAIIRRQHSAATMGQLRFTFLLKGSMTITQAGRRVVLRPGDGAVSIGWQPYVNEVLEESSVLRVTIEREMLESRGIVFPHSVRKLSYSSVLSSGLAAFFSELFDARYYPLSALEMSRILDIIDAFFVQLHLAYVEKFRDTDERKHEQREVIAAYIRCHSQDPHLTVSRIAEHFDMSVRSLQRLFSGADVTLREHLSDAAVVANRPHSSNAVELDVRSACP